MQLTAKEEATASLYAELHAHASPGFARDYLLPGFCRHLSQLGLRPTEELRNKSFLDAGCGGFAGGVSVALALGAGQVTGIDLSAENVRAARERFAGVPRVEFHQENLLRLALPSDSFDFVYCSGVLHHTESPESAFRELARVLKPGGRIYVGVYGSGGLYNELFVPAIKLAGKLIPRRVTAQILRFTPWLLKPSRSLMDVMYVPIERHFHRHDVERWFHDVGIEPTFLRHYDQPRSLKNRLLFGEGTTIFFTGVKC